VLNWFGAAWRALGEFLPEADRASAPVAASGQPEGDFERNLLYLRSILDHLPQGISVFDENLRLRFWNDAFLDVLNLPENIVYPGVSFEELIMVPARRGEYGPGDPVRLVMERRSLALQFLPHRIERTRPNGRTHLVEGRPLKQNDRVVGFITSYTDITDRKEAEVALQQKNELLAALVENMPGGVSVFDRDLHLVLYNKETSRLLGIPAEFAQRRPSFAEVIRYNAQRGEYGDIDIEKKVAEMVELAHHPVAHRFERTRPDGTTIEVHGAPLPGGGFVTIYIDITQRKRTEDELRRRNAIFQTLIDNIPGGVTLFDRDFRLVAHNAEYRRLLGFPDDLFEGKPTLERFFRYNAARGEYGPGDPEKIVRSLLERARLNQAHLFERARPDGTVIEVRGLPLGDGGFVTIYTDITERKAAAAAIERLAHHDTLTGLANRHDLEARLDQVIADATRHGDKVAVLFIDLDRFKSINDTLGHSVGDSFLIEIAARLTADVRDMDIVARLGGDEFVVVFRGFANDAQALAVTEKVMRAIGQPLVLAGQDVSPSASIGIAVYPDDGHDRESLMRCADIAMYHAKQAGRSRFQRFDARMSAATLERSRLEAELRIAVEQQAFTLHYQPQIDVATQRIVGVEALIRWARDDGTPVSPAAFIPMAEESGLIDAIGDWVLREACRTVAGWRGGNACTVRLAINLSARQLKSAQIVGKVLAVLRETGLPAACLELEVTETAAMEDPKLTIDNLHALRELGVGLAIDDFGTGYSSLAYLKLLPITRLKIDRTFVTDIETDPSDATICATTIGLAHSLGFQVVAEGVETAAQFDYLRLHGCDEVQGYHFHRPMPAGDVVRLLAPALAPAS
jgi:diguanylate cyclase (GGDEF)-like protein/PAS domain S-box-containing protein